MVWDYKTKTIIQNTWVIWIFLLHIATHQYIFYIYIYKRIDQSILPITMSSKQMEAESTVSYFLGITALVNVKAKARLWFSCLSSAFFLIHTPVFSTTTDLSFM